MSQSVRSPSPPGQLRQRQRDQVRQALLAGAAKLLEAGEGDFSVHDLAANVGCAVGTVYRHFASKDALVDAVRADQLMALTRQLRDADARRCADSTEHPPLERVAALAHDLYLAARVDPRLLRAALVALTSPDDPEQPVGRAALAVTSALSGSLTDGSEDTGRDAPLDQVGVAIGITLVALALTTEAGRLDHGVAETLALGILTTCLRAIHDDPDAAEQAALMAWRSGLV